MKTTTPTTSALVLVVLMAGAAALRAQELAATTSPAPLQPAMKDMSSSQAPQLQQRYPRYTVQQQDVLSIAFPLSPELNQTVNVQPDGYINLQGAGSIHVQGLTVPEMVETIKTAYVGTLHNPIVSVDLVDYQKPQFTVSGQVSKPGQYELRAPTTVAEAIAVAGGLEPTAKTQVFLFHRTSNDLFQVEKLNLRDVLNGKNANEDPLIKPGDMVFVPEKFITNFKKYVPYSVYAGTYINPASF